MKSFLDPTLTREVLAYLIGMSTWCKICQRNYASVFNLNRHMETAHPLEEAVEEENEESGISNDSESEGSSNDEQSERDANSSESSDESEDSDTYTYKEVRAILRYILKKSES